MLFEKLINRKRDLRGAISILLGAESVCEECAEKAQKMDVRKIMVERIERRLK